MTDLVSNSPSRRPSKGTILIQDFDSANFDNDSRAAFGGGMAYFITASFCKDNITKDSDLFKVT